MWECRNCHETIEHNLDICWNCGYSKEGKPPENPAIFGDAEKIYIEEPSPEIHEDEGVQKRRKGQPRWEYCALVGVMKNQRDLETYYPAIWYFTPNGVEVTQITGKEITEVGRTLARLGEEGWEMVGISRMDDRHSTSLNPDALFFKRRKS